MSDETGEAAASEEATTSGETGQKAETANEETTNEETTGSQTTDDEAGDEESVAEDSLETLLSAAESSLETVEEHLGGAERLEDVDDDTLESILEDVGRLLRVAREAEEVLEAVDLTELPEAVDRDELLEAIEVGEIPAALTEEETDADDLVDVGRLFEAIDLLSAWDATDLGDLWGETRELEEAVEDVADEDGSMVEEAAASVTDDDGVLDDTGDVMEGADPTDALGDVDVFDDPEAYQVAIQQQATKGLDAFREALLETHERFERLYEFNRERMRRTDRGTNSRNPTATSTMPIERTAVGSGVKHSTVPQDVRLSTAPSRTRIYGRRFEREREKRRTDDD